jgi:uncharacterized phage protein (TIGR02220 family)
MKTVVNKKANFTTIHNKLISDSSISLKAKGIMLYMLSKPVGWNYNPKDIANNSKDGLESVYSGLKELIEAKYISRRKNKDGTVDYFVFEDKEENNIIDYQEKPNQEKPNQEKPNQDFADVLIIKDSNNTEYSKKELNNKENIKEIEEVINHLNEKAGTKYKSNSKNTTKHIKARINDGYTLEDFKTVIDKKCSEWLNTDMEKYLCPDTLFGSKFEKYLNQKINVPKFNNKNTQNNATEIKWGD